MKRLIPLTAAAALLTTSPAMADLESQYNRQEAAQARKDDCRHWIKAQWRIDDYFDFPRIRQFADGRLLETKIKINDNGQLECRGYEAFGSAKARLGFAKHFHKDGSGYESTKKIKGNQLIEFYTLCLDWKCPKTYVSKTIMATKLTPEQKADEDAYVRAALAKATECREISDSCSFNFRELSQEIKIPRFNF